MEKIVIDSCVVQELLPEKIVIIGSPGAGKTTLAKLMGSLLKIKVIHLDRIFWKRGWQALSRDERLDSLEKLVGEKQWIIEGTYLDLAEPRLKAADIIIFLDTPPLICLERIKKRHREEYGRTRRDIPLECTDKLTPYRKWRVLAFLLQERGWLEKEIGEIPPKKVIRLCSAEQVKDFLALLELCAHAKGASPKILSALEQELQHFSLLSSPLNNRSAKLLQLFRRGSASLWSCCALMKVGSKSLFQKLRDRTKFLVLLGRSLAENASLLSYKRKNFYRTGNGGENDKALLHNLLRCFQRRSTSLSNTSNSRAKLAEYLKKLINRWSKVDEGLPDGRPATIRSATVEVNPMVRETHRVTIEPLEPAGFGRSIH